MVDMLKLCREGGCMDCTTQAHTQHWDGEPPVTASWEDPDTGGVSVPGGEKCGGAGLCLCWWALHTWVWSGGAGDTDTPTSSPPNPAWYQEELCMEGGELYALPYRKLHVFYIVACHIDTDTCVSSVYL